MCGRFSQVLSKEKVKKQFGLQMPENMSVSYNIAPTQSAYIVTNEAPEEFRLVRWGLIPHWAENQQFGSHLINARAEEIATKPSFRMPVRYHRCLIIADSFYEWQVEGRHKIPLRITSTENNKMLCFAGVWDIWQPPKGQALHTFSIITTAPNKEMSAIHNRMPAMLNSIDEQKEWLLTSNLNTALDLLRPAPDDTLKYYSVSESINNIKNNSADLHLPVTYIKPPTLFD